MKMRVLIPATLLAGFLLWGALAAPAAVAAAAAADRVAVVAVSGEINSSLARQVQSQLRQAGRDPRAMGILVEIDTPGGQVAAAEDIKDAIMSAHVPVAAWVRGHAWSAGAMIAMSADKLYMRPGSSIGAAEPRLLTVTGQEEQADPKVVAALSSEFRAIARARGRNPDVAAKMVDKGLHVQGFEDGKLASLDYQQAVDLKVADGLAADREAVARAMDWHDASFEAPETGTADQIALFLTTPWVAVLLLILGVAAIGFEFFHPGLTLPAVLGVTFLALFFGSNVYIGNAPWWVIALFFGGLGLLAVEAFTTTTHGAMGLVGLLGMLAGVFLAVPNRTLGLGYMAAVALASVVFLVAIARRLTLHGLPAWLTNAQQQSEAAGYVAPRASATASLVGARGQALSVLRPAGVARFGERKLDVVTEGEFLPAGSELEILRVEGTRVVVRRVGGGT